MENFRRNNRSRKPAVMHRAVCSECGNDCEVPFRPTGDKPVFCSNCFRGKRDAEPRRSDRRDSRRDSRRFDSGDRTMYKAVCDKCGKECEVPFKPSSDKPIYCSQCFSKGGSDRGSSQTNNQFDAINAKLDEILRALSAPVSKSISKPKKTSKSKDKKVVSPKKAKGKKKK